MASADTPNSYARGAGDEYAALEQRPAEAQRAQRRQSGDPERRALFGRDALGQYRQPVRRRSP
jgi:hypothetical protein